MKRFIWFVVSVFVVGQPTFGALAPALSHDEFDERAEPEILGAFDRVGLGLHRFAATRLILSWPSRTLVRASVVYLRRGGRLDGRMTARIVLARSLYRRDGDQGLIELSRSGHPDLEAAAIEYILLRLSGPRALARTLFDLRPPRTLARSLVDLRAPRAYGDLPPDEKKELAWRLLMTTRIGETWRMAGVIESLGLEMSDLVRALPVRRDGNDAIARVGRGPVTYLSNACAALFAI